VLRASQPHAISLTGNQADNWWQAGSRQPKIAAGHAADQKLFTEMSKITGRELPLRTSQ
jgi:hypothetical protein